MNRTLIAATLVVASAWAREAVAQDGPKQPTECSGPLDADAVVRCALAARALMAYYEAIAAQETLRFAAELARTAQTLAAFAEGRAKEAMLAGVEADVARAEATRIGLVRFEAERRLAESRAALAVLLD